MKKQKSKLIFALLLSASMLFTSCNEKSDSSSSIEESKTSTNIFSEDNSEISSESLEDASELYSDETSDETLDETSDETLDETSDEISEELSFDDSEETSSADTSDEKTEESSEDISDDFTEQTSNEISNDTSSTSSNDIEESSSENSESSSEETTSEDVSREEPSFAIQEEIIQEFPELDFAYALYDIKTGKVMTEYNTEKLFDMSYTIKPAYVLYLLSEENINLDDTITLESKDLDYSGKSYILERLGFKWFDGDSFTVEDLLEYLIIKNDNTAYRMLTKTYGYSRFNAFMEKLNINIKLGEGDDPDYTSASCEDQLKVWITINDYLNNSFSELSQYFSKLLKNKKGLKLVGPMIQETTLSIIGWTNETSTLNECYIVGDKYIAIILTTANVSIPSYQDYTKIDSKPLEKIAIGLKSVWEEYNK